MYSDQPLCTGLVDNSGADVLAARAKAMGVPVSSLIPGLSGFGCACNQNCGCGCGCSKGMGDIALSDIVTWGAIGLVGLIVLPVLFHKPSRRSS